MNQVMTDVEFVKHAKMRLKDALQQFGTYSFDDKGPREVMDVEEFVDLLQAMPTTEAAKAIKKLHKSNFRAAYLAQTILIGLQDWDELFAISGIVEIFNE